MLIALKDVFINTANSQYATKQSTFMIRLKLLYTLHNIKYIIPQLYLVQCYILTIDFHNTSEAFFILVCYKLIVLTTKSYPLSHTKLGDYPAILKFTMLP